jgi:enamine deaminase RidA (YjgF/YER057c/UK114 family)
MEELLVEGAVANVSLIATSSETQVEFLHPGGVAPAARASGFVPAIVAEDLVFIAGQIANTPEWSLDPRAHVPDYAAWGGTEICKQTEFIIKERIEPILSAAECTLADMVKVQVYLTRAADIPNFLEAWTRHVSVPCALTIALTRGYALVGAICEINVIALRSASRIKKQIVTADIPSSMSFGQPAVQAGGFIFLPGLMALDEAGISPRVSALSGLSRLGAPAAMEATLLMEAAAALCKAAGASLENAVRFNLFFSDLRDAAPVCRTIQKALGGRPVPFSAVKIPGPSPVPGCGVIADIWIWAPEVMPSAGCTNRRPSAHRRMRPGKGSRPAAPA